MITENLSTLKINKLTQEQYDRELENGNLDETALYLTPEIKFNKVLCDSGDMNVSVLTDGAVEIPEINDYSIFAVHLYYRLSETKCVVLCTKSKQEDVEYLTGFNDFVSLLASSQDMFFRFRGSIQGTTLTDIKAQWTPQIVNVYTFDNNNGVLDDDDITVSKPNWIDATVSKIVGVM